MSEDLIARLVAERQQMDAMKQSTVVYRDLNREMQKCREFGAYRFD